MNDAELDALLAESEPLAPSAAADARLVAGIEALVGPPAPAPSAREVDWSWGYLPWRWIACLALAFAFALGADLGRPARVPPPSREPWRHVPNPRPEVEPPQELYLSGQRQLFN